MSTLIILLMVKSIPVGVSIPENILKQIDKDRMDIPRSRYLLRALERSYINQKGITDSPASRIGAPETDESFDNKVR
jgi:hypothetical protein